MMNNYKAITTNDVVKYIEAKDRFEAAEKLRNLGYQIKRIEQVD